jgi:hypothetical protein
MKRALIAVALVAATVLGIDALGDLTQSRPDPIRDDAVTELVVSVEQDRFAQGDDAAAAALWAVCAGQTRSRADAPPAAVEEGRYRIVLAPAVGEHEARKLRGCLEDLTVDRVLGDIESWRTVSVSS